MAVSTGLPKMFIPTNLKQIPISSYNVHEYVGIALIQLYNSKTSSSIPQNSTVNHTNLDFPLSQSSTVHNNSPIWFILNNADSPRVCARLAHVIPSSFCPGKLRAWGLKAIRLLLFTSILFFRLTSSSQSFDNSWRPHKKPQRLNTGILTGGMCGENKRRQSYLVHEWKPVCVLFRWAGSFPFGRFFFCSCL